MCEFDAIYSHFKKSLSTFNDNYLNITKAFELLGQLFLILING